MKPKTNRRTLRKRVRRTIYLTSLINILLFSVIILAFLSLLMKPIAGFASGLIAQTVADEMNSGPFLQQNGISELKSFDPTTEKGLEWTRKIDHMARLDTYIPKNVQEKRDVALEANPNATIAFNSQFNFVTMEVTLDGRTIYSNQQMDMERMTGVHSLVDFFTVRTTKDLKDKNGETIGHVTAFVSPEVVLSGFVMIAFIVIVLVLFALMLTKFISVLISSPVLNPLDQAIGKMRELSQESNVWDNPIKLVRPLREIEELADATNLIMHKMKEYNEQLQQQKNDLEEHKSTLEDQNEELEAQNEELSSSKQRLQEAQAKLLRSDRSIRNLLDNAGQGFLTFGPEMQVDEEYSRECRSIFRRELAGLPFPELLAQGDDEQRKFLESLLQRLFIEKDPAKRAMYMPLLTEELTLFGRTIKLEYKIIPVEDGKEAIMAVLTDITEKRELESQVEVERNILKMVVKVIVGYGDFTDCVRDFKLFYEVELPEILRSDETIKAKLLSIYRDVHTYKGNFSQFGLPHITKRLHEAESQLSEWLKQADSLSSNDLAACIAGLNAASWLDDDFAVLQSVIGDSFFNQEELLMIDKSRIMDIEKKMLALLSPNECKLLLPELRRLRYKPFKELLKGYPDYVRSLADRMERYVAPVLLDGDDFPADTEKYYDFSRSLVHVFRNIIDHAVDTPDERTKLGKEEYAGIVVRATLQQGNIVVDIADDGRGIDTAVIRRKAVEKGIATEQAAAAMTDDEALMLIFHDEFSTKDEVSDISGRGIGLAAVKAEVAKLGGTIFVRSESGRGTIFRFVLPYEELDVVPQVTYPDMLQPCIETTRHYFERFIGVRLEAAESFVLHPGEKLRLSKVTSFVTLKGAVEGLFVMTVDEPLSRAIVRGIVLDPIDEEEQLQLVEDSLAETSNTVLGNSFNMFKQFADFILMEPPITMDTEGASVKYADAEIWTCPLHSEHGAMRISFVIMKRG